MSEPKKSESPPAGSRRAAKLSNEDLAKVEQFLKRAIGNDSLTCPLCRATEWIPGGFTSTPVSDHFVKSLMVGGPQLPSIILVCGRCANTIFINAIMAGLAPPVVTEEADGTSKP